MIKPDPFESLMQPPDLRKECARLKERLEELEAKLAKAVEALRGSRETILELINSRGSETEGTDQDWVGGIDTTIAELKGEN